MHKIITPFERIRDKFHKAKIPTDTPGFYDHPNFLEIERHKSNYLEEYARFVRFRTYDSEYIRRAKSIIEIVAKGLHDGLVLENRIGGCIDTSMTMGRILERYGIWNCSFKGGLTLNFAPETGQEPFHFTPFDVDNGLPHEFGHKWVYAPPYTVVDLTLKLQDYERDIAHLLPDTVMLTSANSKVVKGVPSDILGSQVLKHASHMGLNGDMALKMHIPQFSRFSSDFTGLETEQKKVTLRYVPVAVFASDVPLENINSYVVQGKNAYEYYQDAIKPQLDAVVN